jgi:hypothetical protein
VFVVSWVNPDRSLAAKGFDDYMLEGSVAALDAVEKATAESKTNVIGYCLGGTLLGCTLAYLAAKGREQVACATFLVSLDFSEPGELGVFIDEKQVANLEMKMNERGYLEGSEMAATFNLPRSNDLMWSFVINNYSSGQGAIAVRHALLELGLDPHAGEDAQFLPAQYVLEKSAWGAGRNRTGWHADRSLQGESAGLLHLYGGGSHRTMEDDVQRCKIPRRDSALRAWRLGPRRWHRQSACGEQILLLDQ